MPFSLVPPTLTFMQGNDRSGLHFRGLPRAAYQMPKRGQHGFGLWLPYQVDFKIHWSSASNGSTVDVST